MPRYIDADIAKAKLKEYCIDDDNEVGKWYDIMGIDECIDEIIPTADVRENVRGKWKRRIVDGGWNANLVCSECGYTLMIEDGYNFCPNCGADMRGGKE